jgi:hypothetical protein
MIVQLVDGSPVRGVVARDSYQYYQIYIDQVQEKWDLTVSLTLIYGDAGMSSSLFMAPLLCCSHAWIWLHPVSHH